MQKWWTKSTDDANYHALNAIGRAAPEQSLSVCDCRCRLISPRVLDELGRNGSQESTVWGVELLEVSTAQYVEASERSVQKTSATTLLCTEFSDGGTESYVHFSKQLGAHHTYLVDDEPSPL